jgi:hypothetical protein
MTDLADVEEASALGRALAQRRWGDRGREIDNALDLLAARADRIHPDQAQRLRELAADTIRTAKGT